VPSEGGSKMVRKALIEILLVKECINVCKEDVEKEILEELSKSIHVIPWAAKLNRVTVTDD
jgi:hypothetical protein